MSESASDGQDLELLSMTFAQARELANRGDVVARLWIKLYFQWSFFDLTALVQSNLPDFCSQELWYETVASHIAKVNSEEALR